MPDKMKDPYAIYLAYTMGWSPFVEHNAGCLLAARLGKTYFDSQKTLTRQELLSRRQLQVKLRELNQD